MLAYSGKGQLVVRPISLNDVIDEISQLLEALVSEGFLEYGLDANLPAIEADASQLTQVVTNLIVNASEAIGERGGTIRVSTGSRVCDRDYFEHTAFAGDELIEGVYAYIEVSDTGDGIDDETRERMFEPFFTTKYAGRGLGLATVQGIARSHHGAIDVRSEPGSGTSRRVMFPAVQMPAEPLSRKGPSLDDWRGSGTISRRISSIATWSAAATTPASGC